ncbi:MAG: LysR family transcriptional regulator [Pseudomonadales bacterium]|nr:LysR family transcriptional regulator [Pseudomonadales bacterium]
MDVEVARTFLEIVRSGSFARAAERLFVTQTAVSARVQGLESQLKARLFVRERAGVRLTSEGERFVPYARQLVRAWDQAREDVALPTGQVDQVNVGCELSLWDPFLLEWLVHCRRHHPRIKLRAEVGLAEALVQKIERGGLDVALVYSPEYVPGLQVELLLEEKLVLVTTGTDGARQDAQYVRVGWGDDFLAKHDAAFPDLKERSLFVGLGPLALQYILRTGGSGYFRTRAVEPYLASGQLTRVDDAPEFTYPVYSIRRHEARTVVTSTLQDLRHVIETVDAATPYDARSG